MFVVLVGIDVVSLKTLNDFERFFENKPASPICLSASRFDKINSWIHRESRKGNQRLYRKNFSRIPNLNAKVAESAEKNSRDSHPDLFPPYSALRCLCVLGVKKFSGSIHRIFTHEWFRSMAVAKFGRGTREHTEYTEKTSFVFGLFCGQSFQDFASSVVKPAPPR